MDCIHPEEQIVIKNKTFKDGTHHLEKRCGLCNTHRGYKKQSWNEKTTKRIKKEKEEVIMNWETLIENKCCPKCLQPLKGQYKSPKTNKEYFYCTTKKPQKCKFSISINRYRQMTQENEFRQNKQRFQSQIDS